MDSMCDYSYLLGVSVFSSFTGCTEVPLPFLPRRLVETDSNTNLTHNTFSVLGMFDDSAEQARINRAQSWESGRSLGESGLCFPRIGQGQIVSLFF
jgi:hypothetical protein